jgi:hypothetical protein
MKYRDISVENPVVFSGYFRALPIHPAWLRCESLKYLDIPAISRFARQAPQLLIKQICFCAHPKRILHLPLLQE